jgi:hypothetical protein
VGDCFFHCESLAASFYDRNGSKADLAYVENGWKADISNGKLR